MPANSLPFREIAIFGPGLLGASLALALQKKANVRLWGRSDRFIPEVKKHSFTGNCTTDISDAVTGADLVIFCTPIETMGKLATQILPFLGADACVTDVGSVKGPVVEDLEAILGSQRFLGSHPMAGSEQSGCAAARADLFAGAACILTPTENTAPRLIERISVFWEDLGCEIHSLVSALHDRQIALISHLPHLLAGCLVNAVAEKDSAAFPLAGQGFRDSTRIASGPPEMWSGILKSNRSEILQALQALQTQIQVAAGLLQADHDEGLRNFLHAAKTRRDGIIRKVRYGGN